jgi:uncharacterized membrane protein
MGVSHRPREFGRFYHQENEMSEFLFQLMMIARYGGGHMDWNGGWWVLMLFGMVLFWGLVGLAIYLLVREVGSRRDQRPGSGSTDALETLDRRLAEGLISPEEYRERRALITGAGTEPQEQK